MKSFIFGAAFYAVVAELSCVPHDSRLNQTENSDQEFAQLSVIHGCDYQTYAAFRQALQDWKAPSLNALQLSPPGDRCCDLYWDRNYGNKGPTICLDENKSGDVWQMDREPWRNDDLGSYRCGSKVAYTFCADFETDRNPNSCTGEKVISGAGFISNSELKNWDDKMSTAWLSEYDASYRGAVTFFTDYQCGEKSGAYYGPTEGGAQQKFLKRDLEKGGAWNDKISSYTLPPGYSVDIFEDDNFQRPLGTLIGKPYIDEVTQEMECFDFKDDRADMNDKITSFRITKTGGHATAYWKRVASGTESIDAKVHIGHTTAEGKEVSDSQTHTLSYEVAQEVHYEGKSRGGSTSVSMSESYEQMVQHSYSSSSSTTLSVDYPVTCTTDDGRQAVGLYQWTIESHDGTIQYGNFDYVCRYGELALESPDCPLQACLDPEGSCIACKPESEWMA